MRLASVRRVMSCVEMIALALWFVVVVVAGFVGGLSGVALGLTIPPALLWAVYWWAERKTPRNPPCRNGRCGPFDYSMDGNRVTRTPEEGVRWRCRCGDMYRRMPASPPGTERFVLLDKEGQMIPYMAHRPYRGWKPER